MIAWTVVIKPSTMPNLSLITCQTGKRAKVKFHPNGTKKKKQHAFSYKDIEHFHLGKRSQAVSCAAGIGNDINVRLVLVLVDADHKHGSIFAGSRDDDFLGTTLLTITPVVNASVPE